MKKRQKSQDKESIRTGNSPGTLAQALLDNLYYVQGRLPELATKNDWYMALAYTVRDRLLHNWMQTLKTLADGVEVVSYLSAEFLLGPQLGNHLINLGIWDQVREAVSRHGLKLGELLEQEGEPGLGNGGLGRLAACYLDSLATLEVPAIGYGIRYEFGIFDQEIRDGWQVEITDKWLELGNPWEISRPEIAYRVGWKGYTEIYIDANGRQRRRWAPGREVKGVAHDYPVSGYRNRVTNLLRLWKAEAVESFEFSDFNVGDYYGAVQEKVYSENVTKVLYPNDEPEVGKRLRLGQQHFFVSCSLQDMIRIRLLRQTGGYFPHQYYHDHQDLKEALDLISSGFFSHGDRDLFKSLVDSLLHHDEYLLLADYRSYVDRQDEVSHLFRDEKRWTRMSILNAARMGKFSSDRAIREYCEKVWGVKPL